MIQLSWYMLRSRWQVFIGTFLALTFGVALMATTLLCLAGAQASPNQDNWLVAIAVTLLGNAAGVSGAAAIFVVAGTFAFAVAQRRREFALLRAVGATPGQVRRLVMGEALLIGIAAALAGCAIGVVGSPFFAAWMASAQLAPAGFAPYITWWPLAIAAGVGLVSSLLSAWIAARRASKVAPAEAFFEASVDRNTMTITRGLAAATFLIGAGLLAPLVAEKANTGIGAAYVLFEVLVLIFGVTLLTPLFAPWLLRFISLPIRTTTGRLALATTTNSIRRTSAIIAPIFITISLAAGALSGVATLAALEGETTQDARIDQAALITVIGLAILYTAISIANTCIMAITARFRDFAVLQLAGATRTQIQLMVCIETILLTLVASIAAIAVTSIALTVIQTNTAIVHITVPWLPIAIVWVVCFGITLGTSVVTTLWAFRTPAIRIAAARE